MCVCARAPVRFLVLGRHGFVYKHGSRAVKGRPPGCPLAAGRRYRLVGQSGDEQGGEKKTTMVLKLELDLCFIPKNTRFMYICLGNQIILCEVSRVKIKFCIIIIGFN